MKDRDGNALDSKEFFERWKNGIKEITPAQMNIINLQGNLLVLAGISIGLFVTFNTTWWLFTILSGSFVMSITSLVGLIQKQIILNEFAKAMKGGNENEQ